MVNKELYKKNLKFINKSYGNKVLLSIKGEGCKTWIRDNDGIGVYRCGDNAIIGKKLKIFCEDCKKSIQSKGDLE